MKIVFIIFCFVFSISLLKAQDNTLLNENFSSGIPVTWTVSGVAATTNNGKTCVSMGSGAYLISPVISKPGSLTFSHRASGNGKKLTVEKMVANGNWTEIGNCSPSSSSGWGSTSLTVNDANENVQLRFSASSGTIYLTDIQLKALPDPVFILNQGNTSFGKVFKGEISEVHTFGVTAMYLSGSVVVETSNVSFELSADQSNFSNQISLPVNSSGNLNYYIRFKSPEDITGEVKATITVSITGMDALSFEVTAIAAEPEPSIFVTPGSLSFGYVLFNEKSITKKVIVEPRYLSEGTVSLTVKVDAPFEVSLSDDSLFTSEITLNLLSMSPLPLQFFVRFSPCCQTINQTYQGNVLIEGGGAIEQVPVLGTGVTSMDGFAQHFFISPLGNDLTGDGTFAKPWYNLSKAVAVAEAGDTIHCRGGIYHYDQTVRLSNSGKAAKRICIFAYRNDYGAWEEPIFDFSNQAYGANNRALLITGNFWYLFGIHITKAGDNGIKLEGNNCIVERCVFSYNGDTGIQLGFGHNFSDSHPGVSNNNGSYCAYNVIVDCDSYQNYDPDNYGSDADGFACKMHNGLQNWFLRCRAWNNSDDAWDLYETDYPVFIIECWGFHSGDASQHTVSGGSFQGNGNGIKMGGNGSGGSSEGKHEAWHCVTFNNNKTNSVKGFDQNSHKGGVKLVNCLAYNNGYDFMFEDSPSGTTNDFYNNVCLSNRIEINTSGSTMDHNVAVNNPTKGWLNALNLSFSAADYGNLSEEAAKAPRNGAGALPTGFARLLPGSQLINRGLNGLVCPLPSFIDQPLVGSAMLLVQPVMDETRDLGPYESNLPVNVTSFTGNNTLKVYQPEPGTLMVDLELAAESNGQLMLFNANGQMVNVTETNGNTHFEFNHLFSGLYIVTFSDKKKSLNRKVAIL